MEEFFARIALELVKEEERMYDFIAGYLSRRFKIPKKKISRAIDDAIFKYVKIKYENET